MYPTTPYGTFFRQPEELPQTGEEYHLHSNGLKLEKYTVTNELKLNEQNFKQKFNTFYLQRPDLLP